jgi:hypothetical protein
MGKGDGTAFASGQDGRHQLQTRNVLTFAGRTMPTMPGIQVRKIKTKTSRAVILRTLSEAEGDEGPAVAPGQLATPNKNLSELSGKFSARIARAETIRKRVEWTCMGFRHFARKPGCRTKRFYNPAQHDSIGKTPNILIFQCPQRPSRQHKGAPIPAQSDTSRSQPDKLQKAVKSLASAPK